MGISSSFYASVSGLNANAQRLSGISDNIANSNTSGYKRVETDFTSIVNPGNRAVSFNAGGVRPSTSRDVTAQGSLLGTSNATDISVRGRGMIPLTTVAGREDNPANRPFLMGTTGSFSADKDGFLTTASGLQLLGWRTDELGEIESTVRRESPADLEPVNLNGFEFAPSPTTTAALSVNLPSDAVATDEFNMTLEYFDSLGGDHAIAIKFESTDPATNAWTMTMTDQTTATIVGEAAITFAQTDDPTATPPLFAGGIESFTATVGDYDPTSGTIIVDTVDGADRIEIGIGAVGGNENLTQYDSDFAPLSIEKNGSVTGFLERVELNEQGVLEGIYDSGFRRALFRIPVADVPNPQGLLAEDGQAFTLSEDSGALYLWDSSEGPTGSLLGFTLEESTTDITEELTALIETQRAYSSNAKVVQTVDEMMQETNSLKR